MKYQIRVKGSPMEIVGVPMWDGVYFDTREEAEAALKRAGEEINATWAQPHNVPLWIEQVSEDRIRACESDD